ncbi:MAG: hypothetical protein E6K70_08190 [Planctomycetota bacterium]|nr:MAG: hypothetical protein E6K70_08190 [Planctomycetota bacterium]
MARITRWAVLLVTVLCMQGLVPAQERPAARPKAKPASARPDVRHFQEVSISPDGRFVAWAGLLAGEDPTKRSQPAIYITDLRSPSKAPRHLTAGNGKSRPSEHGIAWSPDGTQTAFLSDAAKKNQLQVYIASATGGAAWKVTSLTGAVTDLHWSPDGKQIGFLFIENPPRLAGPIAAVPPDRRG